MTSVEHGGRLLNARAKREKLGKISPMTDHRWTKDPNIALPPPDVVISRRNFWFESTIDNWIAARIAGRQGASQS
jgi:predicted DNA-binding transcriptional regulator AlpA